MLERGGIPIYEPGLDALVAQQRKAGGRLSFTTSLAEAIDGAEAVFIAVGTPSRRGDGHADLTYVFAAAEEIAAAPQAPDGGRHQVDRPGRHRPQAAAPVRRPDAPGPRDRRRVQPRVPARGLGDRGLHAPGPRRDAASRASAPATCMRALYRPLNLIETPILFTTLETAELIKYATNTFLATKITFINEMADLCERVGADVHRWRAAWAWTAASASKFLHAGPRLRRLLLPQGHAGAGAHRRAARHAPADRRDGGRRQRGPQAPDGAQDHRRLRRHRGRQDRSPCWA